MKSGIDLKELKEVEKSICKGVKLVNSFTNPKTIAAFDIAYSGKKYFCAAVVIDIETKEEIEKKIVSGDEIMPYSPNLAVFREGPVVLEAYRSLKNKPDVLVVKGNGLLKTTRVGLASYVGVLLNRPCLGVAKELLFGRLDEDKIIVDEKIRGMAVKTKPFANPVYVTPGHNIDIDTSVELIRKISVEEYKLPLVLQLAHKYANKEKVGFES